MANWFKEEIEDIGVRLEKAIDKAADELHQQRRLTKTDLEELIVFASKQFAEVLDQRIDKAKHEAGELISLKLAEFKSELGEAAEKQKKTTLHNVTVGVCGAVIVSMISIVAHQGESSGVHAIDVYRTIMAAIAGGYFAAALYRFVRFLVATPSLTKNSVIAGASYLEVLKPASLGPHLIVFVTALLGWAVLNETDFIISLLSHFKH